MGERGGSKTKAREMKKSREEETPRRKIDEKEHLKVYGGLREGRRMTTYLHGRMDSAKKHETMVSGGGPRSARKIKRYKPVVEWRRKQKE